ncbi:NEDD4-binding protein 1 [Spea bombifrons]|uniref:NEDD4-binding protein 1 n=1 Tax=Spea bombifrons TaxID=233779 RepID=UPI00234BE791|nr:NEDD4-binding protein 1 [Spea bombifrons]XP_053304914.1 NEDD4-binding protein 1 [Spea bombifrons]
MAEAAAPGGSGRELVDEFTAPADKRSLLERSRGRIQALFPVLFTVLGSLESFHYAEREDERSPGHIWLQIKGEREAVRKAKEYVKGLCEPEMEAKESYPKEMHCIFVGAKSLFLNRLIQDTYANISVLEIGVLSIKGATEPVVMAQSQVQQFVSLFRNNESVPCDKEPDVKKKFKCFVEAHADKYTVDLLLLPSALKDALLGLTGDDRRWENDDSLDAQLNSSDHSSEHQINTKEKRRKQAGTPVTELTCQLDSVFFSVSDSGGGSLNGNSSLEERLSVKRRYSESDERCAKKLFSLDGIQVDGPVSRTDDASNVPIIDLVSESSDWEDSVILVEGEDHVSAETEYKILVNFFKTMGYSQEVVEKVIGEFGQSEEPLKLLEEIEKENNKVQDLPCVSNGGTSTDQFKPNKTIPGGKNIRLPVKESFPVQEVIIDLTIHKGSSDDKTPPSSTCDIESDACDSFKSRLQAQRTALKNFDFVARGASGPSPPCTDLIVLDGAGPSKMPPVTSTNRSSQGPLAHRGELAPAPSERPPRCQNDPPVTGVQIFLNSIKVPYRLELKNEPGRRDLKRVIIDGSNVAMSHGLNRFFSCRGVAIAVEYFWKRGHRDITVFVPQWRTKRDPNITEQHFLQQLQDLGILSFTPARTVLGTRIASHDDRFLLHLAERTGGIIVTNDNLREFVVESPVWREIIKHRLLQYTFVGDLFMIPDDPLGRHGPNLDDFLRNHHDIWNVPGGHALNGGIHRPVSTCTPRQSVATGVCAPRQSVATGVCASNPCRFPVGDERLAFNPTLQNILRPLPLTPPQRTLAETSQLKEALLKIFPESNQQQKIHQILSSHPYMRDLNALSAMVLD